MTLVMAAPETAPAVTATLLPTTTAAPTKAPAAAPTVMPPTIKTPAISLSQDFFFLSICLVATSPALAFSSLKDKKVFNYYKTNQLKKIKRP